MENTSNLKVRKELSHVAKEVLMAIAELLMAADNVEVQKILDKVDTVSHYYTFYFRESNLYKYQVHYNRILDLPSSRECSKSSNL